MGSRACRALALAAGLIAGGLLFADLALAGPAALTPEQRDAVARVESYLNRITTLKARFVQISSNGGFAEGDLLVKRPGRLRFEYDPPYPVLLVANGTTLLYYDKELDQTTFIPLWETPLWFLIRDAVDLDDSIEVVAVTQDRATLRVTLRDVQPAGEAASVTLVFSEAPLILRKWEITDAQGITTQVALVNPEFGVELDNEVFDYGDITLPRLRQRRN